MTKKIIVLTLSGIGTQDVGFTKKMEQDIREHTHGTPLENNIRVIPLNPFTIGAVDENLKTLYNRLDNETQFGDSRGLRASVMRAFSDALSFERNAPAIDSTYRKAHLYLRHEMKKVSALMLEYPGSRLVIVAAALGAHILSTYIWDADHNLGVFHENPADRTENLRNLDYLVSVGCTIPFFVSGLHETEIKAIDKRNIDFEWDNFYDRNDALGWPLEPLSPSYRELVTDYEINSGMYIGSHMYYWEDKDFIVPFTKRLIELFESHVVATT